jgi:putative SOS response-associated peptidase YedK
MQWWLLPFWSKEPRIKYTTFNARVESVAEAASFREPFKRRRCLIPAMGWYEWQSLAYGKQPWYFHPTDGELVAFAGLWDRWEGDDQAIESCSIIIGEPNAAVRKVHDRMPFLISRERQAEWLSKELTNAVDIMSILRPAEPDAVIFHRVSNNVNAAKNEGVELVEPIDAGSGKSTQ